MVSPQSGGASKWPLIYDYLEACNFRVDCRVELDSTEGHDI